MSENQALTLKLSKLMKLKSESDHISEYNINEVNTLKKTLSSYENESSDL